MGAKIEQNDSQASILKLNFILIVLTVFLLLSYIVLSNFFVAQKYALNIQKLEFNQSSARAGFGKSGLADSDLRELMSFTQRMGMIEAKDISTMLKSDSFALSRINY